MISQSESGNNYQHQANEYQRPLSMMSGSMEKLLEYDISNISKLDLRTHKKRLKQLAEFAKLSHIQIRFDGLVEYIQKFGQLYCCSWFSQHEFTPERDITQLLIAIQSQSKVSPRKYNIRLIYS